MTLISRPNDRYTRVERTKIIGVIIDKKRNYRDQTSSRIGKSEKQGVTEM